MKDKINKYITYIRNIDYRHYICGAITFVFLFLAFFYFKYADTRLIESFKDLGSSTLYYVNELFELDLHAKLSVIEFSSVPFTSPLNLPSTWEEFKILWNDYWTMWASKDTFDAYMTYLGDILYWLSKGLMLLMPVIILIVIIANREMPRNNDYNKDSKPLKIWKKYVENKFYLPVKHWILGFVEFIKDNNYYLKLWAFIWAYSFNLITILIEFIAYYLYFITAFDWVSIYTQILKLFMDLSVMISFIPLWGWLLICIYYINKLRRKIGYSKLNHMEFKDRGFINERPIVIMLNGTMGSKKTTCSTDMALSQQIMFRDKAFEKILENDLKFPYFPFINLENDLRKAIDNHSVYNLATCKRYVMSKKRKFEKHKHMRYIFMYDYEKYGTTYDDKLCITSVWDMIENYTQLYFIYIIQSSLLISNYSIRVDDLMEDIGNFPLWNTDLFQKDSKLIDAYSRHAHILDFDMLRLGKKVLDYNEKADCFEFGVINITEIGKERGNSIELREIKKSDVVANQKNDLFNTWLKMIRHSATIDNFPFVKVITDDQRAESWGADARDLCELVYIEKCSKMKLAMPMFWLEDLIGNWLLNKFTDKYYNYRFNRGDNTLRMYLYHGLIGKINKYIKGVYNTFGYYKLDASVESGKMDSKPKDAKYYLMFKKIYSRRFSTDCYSDFFNQKAIRSKLGLDDLREFAGIKATFEELQLENSYFFSDLTEIAKNDALDK